MKLKKSSAYLSYRIWALEIVSGIILLCLAFWISIHADISNAAQRLFSTVNYVKEQCNNNQKMELASETKSLMRIMESAEYINWNLASDMEKSGFEEPDQTLLENYAKESYVTGILLLSPQGAVEQEYHTDERNVWDLYENIDAEALLDVWNFPEKTYASRVDCEDGSHIDLAAVGRTDRSGILVAFYHTSKEYCHIFVNSMEQLLTGYSVKHDGTIVISNGEEIVASNDSRLVGVSMDDNEILRTIRRRAEGSKLVHVRDGGDHRGQKLWTDGTEPELLYLCLHAGAGSIQQDASEYVVCGFGISACSDHCQHGEMADRAKISEAETSDPAGICSEIGK